jgi:hypothetical protein
VKLGEPIAGWQLHDGDYAEPVKRGGGWVEVQDNGDLQVCVELGQADCERYPALESLQETTIPAAVLRELLKRFDAAREEAE